MLLVPSIAMKGGSASPEVGWSHDLRDMVDNGFGEQLTPPVRV